MPGSAGTCGVDPSAPSYDVWRHPPGGAEEPPPETPAAARVRGKICKSQGSIRSGTIGIPAMVKTEREYRDDICQIGRLVFQKGWIAANDGNITIRLDAERILATPTGVCKGLMQPDDLIVVDMKGNKISGRLQGTSEIAMHTTVYGLRPDIKAVVHAHPPVATGFATAGRQLNLALLPEAIIGLGCVPLAGYGPPPRADAAVDSQVRRTPDGQSRRRVLRRGRVQGLLQNGDHGALRAHPDGGRTFGWPQGLAAHGSG